MISPLNELQNWARPLVTAGRRIDDIAIFHSLVTVILSGLYSIVSAFIIEGIRPSGVMGAVLWKKYREVTNVEVTNVTLHGCRMKQVVRGRLLI